MLLSLSKVVLGYFLLGFLINMSKRKVELNLKFTEANSRKAPFHSSFLADCSKP